MKVGDLVQLSGYGAARGFNRQLTMVNTRQTGLITETQKGSYPFVVQWSKSNRTGGLYWCHHRRELKYAGR